MKYKGKVSPEFIQTRNTKVSEDRRPKDVALRQWDFEFVEYHQSSVSLTGHKIYEGYEYDTVHEFFGNCDFKHVNRNNEFHISPYILKQLKSELIDHIVLWRFVSHPGNWKRPLEEGDSVQYEILDYIPRQEVLETIKKKSDLRGFTINLL
jgi:hypothetical protein